MNPIIVTGASGFVGSAFLVRLLRSRSSAKIYLFSRRPLDPQDAFFQKLFESPEEAAKLWKKVTVILVDLSEEDSLRSVLDKMTKMESEKYRVFHLAAQISEKTGVDFMKRLNVEATRILLHWANHNAERFTYLSSMASFGSVATDRIRSEKDFDNFALVNRASAYCVTKREAHKIVLNDVKITADILCPSIIHGKWDSIKDTRSRLNVYLNSKFNWVPPGGANIVSLDQVLDELEATFKLKNDGSVRTRLVVGMNLSFADYVLKILKFAGKSRELKILPRFLFRCLEIVSVILPSKMKSLIHGGRYLYFKSEFKEVSDGDSEKEAIVALEESIKSLKKLNKALL